MNTRPQPHEDDTAAGHFSAELEALLRSHAMRRQLVKGEVLFTYGSNPDALFCVERGAIKVSSTAQNGREAVVSLLEPGQWFGEVSLFIDAHRVYDTRAAEASELLVIPAATFHTLIAREPRWLMEFTQLICRRYRSALEWIDEVILMPFPVRLARRLLAVEHAHALSTLGTPGVRTSGAPAALRLSQEDLGHMLGVSRQSVNRQLKDWEKQGVLRLEYGRLTLSDKAALQAIASESAPGT
ncbi:Crp/Fnr family transcriptional regulator [Cupriavidus sp. YAF13]|uniref:Crp/Fnr family transcriptional regulator n=1 Tax=Cupriavidus sp. YAF13 TaxID=3233075 RepID=UPI003F901E99